MQALKISLFVLCVVSCMTLINSTGITDSYRVPNAGTIDTGAAQNAGSVSSCSTGSCSAVSDTQTTDSLFGWKTVVESISMLMQILSLIFLPYPYLTSVGCNSIIAGIIQVIFNASFVLAIYQVITKFGLGGNTV